MSVPGQGDPGVDVPVDVPAPAPTPLPSPLPTPTPLEPTPSTDPLALTLQTLADRVDALEKTGSFAPGMIAWTAGADAPPGWLVADGTAFDVNLYAALAIVCPTGFLPNLIDRFPVGAGTTYPLLTIGGAASITLTGAQSGMPAHMHTIAAATGSTTPADVTSDSTTPGAVTTGSTTPGATGSTTPGGGTTGSGGGGSTGGVGDHTHSGGAAGIYVVDAGSFYGLTTIANTAAAGAHSHTVPAHTHTYGGAAHTHTSAAHTHTVSGAAHTHVVPGSPHTHTLPDTDTAAAIGASAAISTLSPYIALTPLIHV